MREGLDPDSLRRIDASPANAPRAGGTALVRTFAPSQNSQLLRYCGRSMQVSELQMFTRKPGGDL